jgi:hypothetical protein
MKRKLLYDRAEINALLAKTLAEIGPETFSGMGIVELEGLIRSRHPRPWTLSGARRKYREPEFHISMQAAGWTPKLVRPHARKWSRKIFVNF